MNFLNVGPWELAVILVIAILLVGPKRVAEIARTIGRTTSQVRRLSGQFLGTIQAELQAAEQEAHQALDSIAGGGQEPIASITDEIQATGQETRQVLEGAGEDERAVTTSIKAELQTVERETRQAMEEIVESVKTIVRGEQGVEEKQDEEANRE